MIEMNCLTMAITKEDLEKKYDTKNKKLLRVTVPADIAEFVEQLAIDEFRVDHASRGKAITMLIMIAQEALKKESEKE